MENKKVSKIERWRAKYAAILVATGCLYSTIVSWGENWLMTALLFAGVLICGTFGMLKLKSA